MVTVECEHDQMRVHIDKTSIPDFRLNDLRLLDRNCQLTKTENSSHMTITAPLTGCGTTLEHTDESVIYRNMVKDAYAPEAIIGRLQVCFKPSHFLGLVLECMIRLIQNKRKFQLSLSVSPGYTCLAELTLDLPSAWCRTFFIFSTRPWRFHLSVLIQTKPQLHWSKWTSKNPRAFC